MSINPRDGTTSGVGPLHAAAMAAMVAGALGSLGFMLRVGHRNHSVILLLIFGIWVLSPFAALLFAGSVWRRAALDTLMLVLALGSLTAYGLVALGPPMAKPASVFLLVPLASWLLMAIVLPLVAFRSGRQ